MNNAGLRSSHIPYNEKRGGMDEQERKAFDEFCVQWAKATCEHRTIFDGTTQEYRRLHSHEWARALDTGTRNMLCVAWIAGNKYASSKPANACKHDYAVMSASVCVDCGHISIHD